MKRIDANVILRYLLDDHAELSEKASGIIEGESVFVSMEVMCEVVYVLCGVYKVRRDDVAKRLADFVKHPNVSMDHVAVFCRALVAFAEDNIDFVDSILFAHYAVSGDGILTFDKKLARMVC